MKKPLFTGACTALVTPFLDGKLNHPMLRQLLRRQTDAGIQAVVLAGTTGEGATLSDPEKLTLIRLGKEYLQDKALLIAGAGSNDTAHAVALAQAAEEAGADALLVVSPYYNKATEDGLCAHYLKIAQSVHIPVILYNVPSRTGLDIPVSVYRRLCRVPNIAGVKEATTDLKKIAQILAACGPDLPVWSGEDALTAPMMALGAQGVISVAANVCPVEVGALAQAALAGDFDTAAALQLRLLPLNEALFSQVNPVPVKAAMELIGYDCGVCRLPLTELGDRDRMKMVEALRKIGYVN